MVMSLYKKLIVWQKSIVLLENVYALSRRLPKSEDRNLVSQMRRCAVSIPSNIAEGQYRVTPTQKRQFLKIAYASCAELETQLHIVEVLRFIPKSELNLANDLLEQIIRMLNKLIDNSKS